MSPGNNNKQNNGYKQQYMLLTKWITVHNYNERKENVLKVKLAKKNVLVFCVKQACVIDTCVYESVWESSNVNTHNREPRNRTCRVGGVLYLRRLHLETRV